MISKAGNQPEIFLFDGQMEDVKSMIMDGETGTVCLSKNVTRVKPGVTLRPCHSHRDIEEIVYVIDGKGEVWIEDSKLLDRESRPVFRQFLT